MYPTTEELLACQESATLCWAVATPVPLAAIVVEAFVALLVNPIEAAAPPLACGEKVRVKVALCPADRVAGSDKPEMLNSELLEAADEMVTLAPLAVSVVVRLLLVPTFTLPKERLAGFTDSWPLAVSAPSITITKGEFGAVDKILSDPFAVPAEAEVNITVKVRLWPAFNCVGVERPEILNAGPDKVA